MVKNSLLLYKLLAVLFLFFSLSAYAQQTPENEASVRQQYELPDPTVYEGFYDIKTGMYYVYPKIGDIVTGPPFVMTPKEYQDFMMMQASRDYYRDKSDRFSLMFR